MVNQNFKNHRKLVPSYHFLTLGSIIALLVISMITATNEFKTTHLLIAFSSIIMISIAFHARIFSLRAQDRAIRAEENLRYFILSGNQIDARITMAQIIALRFAGDDEFVYLTQQAADENLSSKAIKLLIKNWRADHHRL